MLQNLVWTLFASSQRKAIEECPVLFENVRSENPASISDLETDDDAFIFISTSGNFEIITDHVVVEGFIKSLDEEEKEYENVDLVGKAGIISQNEIYKELRRRGCVIGNNFKILENLEVIDDGKCKNFKRKQKILLWC